MIQSLEFSCVIATGTEDIYSPPAYIDYLKSLVPNKNNFSFKVVKDAPHEIGKLFEEKKPEVVSEYINQLFG